jgi:hypothetical protein
MIVAEKVEMKNVCLLDGIYELMKMLKYGHEICLKILLFMLNGYLSKIKI